MKVMFLCRGAEYIGVEYLSACLKARQHTTELVFDPGLDDMFYFRFPAFRRLNRWPHLINRIKTFKPDVLAISAVSNTFPYIYQLVKQIKQTYNCYTIIGGIHATVAPEYVLRSNLFDAVCVGEGEDSFIEILDYLERREDPRGVKNFYFLREGEIIRNPLRELRKNLDSLPLPDKDLFFNRHVFRTTLTILTARGCVYTCNFCINDYWKKIYNNSSQFVRRHSPARVISELRYFIKRYPIKRINFQDEVFTIDKRWLSEFCEDYRRFIGLPFQCNVHPHFVSDDIAMMLKEANCYNVCFGVQTANEDKRLKLLAIRATNEEIKNTVLVLKKHGIKVYLEYIFALPHETLEDIADNISFNHSLRPNNTATFIFYPFLGTTLLDRCLKENLISKNAFEKIKKGEGSFHYESLLQLPIKSISHTTAALLPLITPLPKRCAVILVSILSSKYLQWLVKTIQLFSLPMHNFFQFQGRITNFVRFMFSDD